MLDRLLAFLDAPPRAPADTVGAPFARRDLALAVLLLEAAQCDGRVSIEEIAAIEKVMRDRLALDGCAASALLRAARTELDAALDDWIFARQVRDGFPLGERIAIVQTLWQLVYADGRLARLEEAMLRRLAVELDVPSGHAEAARAAASGNAPIVPDRDVEAER